jgi:hypothetical protein
VRELRGFLADWIPRDRWGNHGGIHTRLDAAGVPQSDAARVLGHAVAGMSYGTYSQAGPGLKRVAAVVEEVRYLTELADSRMLIAAVAERGQQS